MKQSQYLVLETKKKQLQIHRRVQFNITDVLTPSSLFLLQKLVVPQQATEIPVLHCLLIKHVGAWQYLPRSQRDACRSSRRRTFRHTYVYTCACHGPNCRHVYASINLILFCTMYTFLDFYKLNFRNWICLVFQVKK